VDWYEDAMDGIEQLLEATSHLKASSKYKPSFVPISAIWEAKEDAYKEMGNLLALIAEREQPYKTEWSWRE